MVLSVHGRRLGLDPEKGRALVERGLLYPCSEHAGDQHLDPDGAWRVEEVEMLVGALSVRMLS